MRSRTTMLFTCLPVVAAACSSAPGDPSARATIGTETQAESTSLPSARAARDGAARGTPPPRPPGGGIVQEKL